jgi:histone-lysine N-methyltransferase SETMAR
MLTYSVVLLYDNTCLHTAAHTQAMLEHFNPTYSPDLALSDYHLFTYLKNWLQLKHFNNYENLMEDVRTWLSSQVTDFFDTGIQKLIHQYNCLRSGSDYVKK